SPGPATRARAGERIGTAGGGGGGRPRPRPGGRGGRARARGLARPGDSAYLRVLSRELSPGGEVAVPLHELRKLLEGRFPDAVPVTYRTAGAVATGLGELDRMLPGGGLPRGRLAAWVPGGGATAVLQAACLAAGGRGERGEWGVGGGAVAGGLCRAGPLLGRPALAGEG